MRRARILFRLARASGEFSYCTKCSGGKPCSHFFTSESVTEGHPDKICDQISDSILDAILAQDPDAHVACECAATTGMVLVMGEISTKAYVPISDIVRKKIVDIGYDRAKYGFDGHSCSVLVSLDEQSPDIAQGVNREIDMDQGAGRPGHDVRLRVQ